MVAVCVNCQRAGVDTPNVHQNILKGCFGNGQGACVACRKLSALERKIEGARRTLNQLLAERDDLSFTLNQQHDPFATRLPVEIASRIFTHCRPIPRARIDLSDDDRYDYRGLIDAVFHLSQVCANWRRVAQSTPELWDVFCARFTSEDNVQEVAIASQWLKRSGELPLFIQIRVESTTPSYFRKLFPLIISHSLRWEFFDLMAPLPFMKWFATMVSSVSLYPLKHLKLQTLDEPAWPSNIKLLNASPTTFTQRGCSSHHFTISWERLTHFYATAFPFWEAVHLFQSAHLLLHCEISAIVEVLSAPAPSSPTLVTSASLNTFVVSDIPSYMWDCLAFPSLQTLHVTQTHNANRWIHLRDFVYRSGCRIQDLRLYARTDDFSENLVEVLASSPSLVKLALIGRVIEQDFFAVLAKIVLSETPHAASPFLGKLTSLICKVDGVRFQWSPLASFLHAMTSRQSESLQSLEIQLLGWYDDEFYLWKFDKDTSELIMNSVRSLENCKLVDYKGRDLVPILSRHGSV
ncbi:hypothetical protein CPB83DRAFT_865256 [Crepidotus variabilis]|uniref:F-box domain-containing protein n=1 Tax=Crepidotus variabilis TaxID=179855 RepID=A0A9P6E3E1_9AGAR|nr:hypothetical protein CPB83DRAFT_865256 [Crepidotus variabilis]